MISGLLVQNGANFHDVWLRRSSFLDVHRRYEYFELSTNNINVYFIFQHTFFGLSGMYLHSRVATNVFDSPAAPFRLYYFIGWCKYDHDD